MNYYELRYLEKHLKNKLLGGIIYHCSTRFKNSLEFYCETARENFKIVFSSAPGNIALYVDSMTPLKKNNTLSFFEEIYNVPIESVETVENDRVLMIGLENKCKLVFRLFSNKANVFLVKDNVNTQSFKDSDETGDTLPEFKSQEILKVEMFADTNSNLKKRILALNPLLPRAEVDAMLKQLEGKIISNNDLLSFLQDLDHQLKNKPSPRVTKTGITTIFSEKFIPETSIREFFSVNDLVAYRYKTYAQQQRLRQRKTGLQKEIATKIKRVQASLKHLKKADKGIEKAKNYEKYGHLLMAIGHKKIGEEQSIEVEDFYNNNEPLQISIDNSLSIVQNAEKYYKKSSAAYSSFEDAQSKIPEMEKTLKDLEKLKSEMDEIHHTKELDSWHKSRESKLKSLGLMGNDHGKSNSLFYITQVKGYIVWIGKNAKNNDKLVQLSHKEDVWMHARGVAGSHVIIRMENKKEMPPKDVLLEVASYAAFNSKAKGSKVVPVIITKRKFVRKPKGAPAGAVVVEKESVELVEPKKPV